MAEPLQAIYNEEFINQFSERVHAVYGAFDRSGFISKVIDNTWDGLALKARMRRITEMLGGICQRRISLLVNGREVADTIMKLEADNQEKHCQQSDLEAKG